MTPRQENPVRKLLFSLVDVPKQAPVKLLQVLEIVFSWYDFPGTISLASPISRTLTIRASDTARLAVSLIPSLFLRQAVPGQQYGSFTLEAPNFSRNQIVSTATTVSDLPKFFLPLLVQFYTFNG